MNPKKHSEFKNGIAKEVGVHSQLVDDFITFYYSRVRKKLSKLEFPRIYIEGLGTFYLRKNKLENAHTMVMLKVKTYCLILKKWKKL